MSLWVALIQLSNRGYTGAYTGMGSLEGEATRGLIGQQYGILLA